MKDYICSSIVPNRTQSWGRAVAILWKNYSIKDVIHWITHQLLIQML